MTAQRNPLPPYLQSALRLPLIETLDALGGRARPGAVYERLADQLSLDPASLAFARPAANGKQYRVFEQQVRWTRQTAVVDGLISRETRGVWELTREGRRFAELTRIKPGHVVMLYKADDGIALCAHAEDAASLIDCGSVNLILTSPPYPIVRRAYGRLSVQDWLRWMSELTGLWKELLTPDGTLAINLMDVHAPGSPNYDPYVERFTLDAIDRHGLKLAGRMPWYSPTKLGHIEWTAKRKQRPRQALEHILLFSPSDNPAWDATRLEARPRPFRSDARKASDARRAGANTRPSGLSIREGAFGHADRMADNLIIAGGAPGSDAYSKACRAQGLPIHPARMPAEAPRQIIRLTTAPGDLCYDPCAGSGVVARAAQDLGRRWITSEPILEYAQGSLLRFEGVRRPEKRPCPT